MTVDSGGYSLGQLYSSSLSAILDISSAPEDYKIWKYLGILRNRTWGSSPVALWCPEGAEFDSLQLTIIPNFIVCFRTSHLNN